jgi:chromosome segregation ATPase
VTVTTRELKHRRQLYQSVKTVVERLEQRIQALESKADPTPAEGSELARHRLSLTDATDQLNAQRTLFRDAMRGWANSTDATDQAEEAKLEAARAKAAKGVAS